MTMQRVSAAIQASSVSLEGAGTVKRVRIFRVLLVCAAALALVAPSAASLRHRRRLL